MSTDGAATWMCPAEHMWCRKWGGTEISAMLQTGSRQEPLPEPATLTKSGTLCLCPQAMFWEGFQRGGGCCAALDLQAVPGRDRGSSHTFTGRTSLAPFGGDNPQSCVLHQNYKGNENRKLKHTRLICLPPISCFPSGVMNTHLQ